MLAVHIFNLLHIIVSISLTSSRRS
jgi:hypothetical protein